MTLKRFLVDGHVHVHAGYNEEEFLAAAHANLTAHGAGFPALMLAEMAGTRVFARWRSGASAWPVRATAEDMSLVLGERLLVLAGRQIVTAERIEVLAQLTAREFVDGRTLEETLEEVRQAGALAVLPWGVGKWIGARGRMIRDAIERFPVRLGDNAGRPTFWPDPPVFRHRDVLPGTDPLRLPGEQHLVGSFGFALTGEFDLERPGQQIRDALQCGAPIASVGRRVGLTRFLRQQAGLRIAR